MVLRRKSLAFVLALIASRPALGADQSMCINTKQGHPVKGDTIACYSDDDCKYAVALGGEPIRDFDPASAPFALARGKIAAIVTSSPELIEKTEKAGGSCRPLKS